MTIIIMQSLFGIFLAGAVFHIARHWLRRLRLTTSSGLPHDVQRAILFSQAERRIWQKHLANDAAVEHLEYSLACLRREHEALLGQIVRTKDKIAALREGDK